MNKESAIFQIKSLERTIGRNYICKIKKEESGLVDLKKPTPTQLQIMDYIIEHYDEGIYQKDLEKALNLRRATISGVLQTMEKNHMIIRKTVENDTRQKRILLDGLVKESYIRGREKRDELEKIITRNIPKEKMDVFFEVIEMMKSNIKEDAKE